MPITAMEELIQDDKNLLIYLNNLGDPAYDQFWILLSETWIWIPFYAILLYLLYKNYPLRSLVFILIFIALGVTVSDQLAGIYKYGIARLRPCNDPSLDHLLREVKCGGPYGFYSAHASNTFFLATFLYRILHQKVKYIGFILIIWAIFVSYSRIYLSVHYPLDVVTGGLFGFLLGGFFSTLTKRVLHKQKMSL